jgi:hypothetical protein
MGTQDGKVHDKSAPPFATKDGKSAGGSMEGNGLKGTDFSQNTQSAGQKAAPVPGRDFTKESRPQSEAKKEVVVAPGEIAKGGVQNFADPGSVSGSGKLGGVTPVGGGPKPFKGLK